MFPDYDGIAVVAGDEVEIVAYIQKVSGQLEGSSLQLWERIGIADPVRNNVFNAGIPTHTYYAQCYLRHTVVIGSDGVDKALGYISIPSTLGGRVRIVAKFRKLP
jgi:hypothetical protein